MRLRRVRGCYASSDAAFVSIAVKRSSVDSQCVAGLISTFEHSMQVSCDTIESISDKQRSADDFVLPSAVQLIAYRSCKRFASMGCAVRAGSHPWSSVNTNNVTFFVTLAYAI